MQSFADNLFTDDLIGQLMKMETKILMDQRKEIIPPLAHRLLILKALREQIVISTLQHAPEDQDSEQLQTTEPPSENSVRCHLCDRSYLPNWDIIWEHLRLFLSPSFPLVADNLVLTWNSVSRKILRFAESQKRSLVTLGISEDLASGTILHIIN